MHAQRARKDLVSVEVRLLANRQTDSHFHFPLVCVMVSRLFSPPREADFVFGKMVKNWRSFHHMATKTPGEGNSFRQDCCK